MGCSVGKAVWGVATGMLAANLVLVPARPALAEAPELSLPLDCPKKENCFIQNYVDLDPSKKVRDYRCGQGSYEGHKGTDFRIRSIAAVRRGVAVLASAPGVVKALRNGMKDVMVGARGAPDIKGRECGNGLVIDHGKGWETQYCHLRRGSVAVKKGQRVKRGARVGMVGLSGNTAFPHVHIEVRHNGQVVDPFRGEQPSKSACMTKTNGSLWQKDILERFPYTSGRPFMWGFAVAAVKSKTLVARGGVPAPANVKAPALVFYGMALNLEKGDQLRIRLTGPNGNLAATLSKPMDRHKATRMMYVGKKRLNFSWPRGTYKGVFSLERKGTKVWQKSETLVLE